MYLATVVHVTGSAYRKPGARMLVTAGGAYAGSVSGGCLEAEVARKIAWLTRSGPRVERYRSSIDDDPAEVPYGLGCGGTVWILMETGAGAAAVLDALEAALDHRASAVAISTLSGSECGTVLATSTDDGDLALAPSTAAPLPHDQLELAWRALTARQVLATPGRDPDFPHILYSPIRPLPRLTVFGAGDDAQPLVRFAVELGWEVTVADGRSNLLRPQRFPAASQFRLLHYATPEQHASALELSHPALDGDLHLEPDEFAVILTHSLSQDRALLQALLPLPLSYLGVLGPLHRTRRLLEDLAPSLGLTPAECLGRLHAPVGLDFGGGDASVIALSIVAEMQMILGSTSGAVERKRTPLAAIA